MTFFEIRTVTPQDAGALLETNTNNRNVHRSTVENYVRDMRAGAWRFTGEPIILDPDGKLLDGQHRLHAIVKSGVTLGLPFVVGVDREAQGSMGTGTKRTVGDILSMRAEKFPNELAALAKKVKQYKDRGEVHNGVVTPAEVDAVLDEHPELRDVVGEVTRMSRRGDLSPVSPSIAMLAYWILQRIDAQECAEFFAAWSSKTNLSEGDPVLALIRRLAQAERMRERLGPNECLFLVLRAWNARRRGEKMQRLNVTKNGERLAVPNPL